MKIYQFVKNLFFSFSANFVSLVVSILMVMFVPKFLPIEDYGMWQLFLFYFSYLGFLHFGWEDGIYLRYAGKRFDELDPKLFSGQLYGIIGFQVILTVIAVFFALCFISDPIKKYVFICSISLAPFVNFNTACNFIMQITNRIDIYAKLILTERICLLLLVFFCLTVGYNQFCKMYWAKLGSVVIVAVCGSYFCRNLLKPRFYTFKQNFQEAIFNIEIGIKLMIANIASMLIIGVIRYGISIGWDIATFGKVSLTLGISNFLMIFINSISVVFFPMLKRMDNEKLPILYVKIRSMLAIILFFMLLFYYPLKEILSWWLPQYVDSLIYMSVLFPICLFESKVGLLINTYLKSMRQEALMLKINVCSVIIAIIVTYFTVFIIHDLDVVVLSIVLLYAFRCELAEYFIEKMLNVSIKKDVCVEMVLVSIFIVTGYVFNSWFSLLIYGCAYVLYLCFNYRKFLEATAFVRR